MAVQDVRRFSGDVLSLEMDRPGGGFELAADNVEQGCLSRTVGADDGMTFLFLNLEFNTGQDLQTRKVFVNILDVKIIAHDVTSSGVADLSPLLFFFPKNRCLMFIMTSDRPPGTNRTMKTKMNPMTSGQRPVILLRSVSYTHLTLPTNREV